MVRSARVGLSALVLGLAVVGTAYGQSSWLPTWLGGKPAPRPEDKAPALEKKDKKVPDQEAELDALMKSNLRRIAVCLELQKVAEETGDEELRKEAKRLERLADELYKSRSDKLLGAGAIGLGGAPKVDNWAAETRDTILGPMAKDKRGGATRRPPGEDGR
jgi:hypothetical protein